MDRRQELLKRVRDDAVEIDDLVSRGMNAPLGHFIDQTSFNALCDSFRMDPEDWAAEDLEKILIIRDGLYKMRNTLRDAGDGDEYSAERLLSAVDRLYADLERAFRELNQDELARAHAEIAALQRTPSIQTRAVPKTVAELQGQASEVLTNTHITINNIEVNLVKIVGDINLEMVTKVKLAVRRLSATAFAIKLSLEQNVIFQGTIKFLAEGADKVLDELRNLVASLQRQYNKARDLVSDLNRLVESGHRFTRFVTDFLQKVFSGTPPVEREIKLQVQDYLCTDALLCALEIDSAKVLLAGKSGTLALFDTSKRQIADEARLGGGAIYSLGWHTNGDILIGSEEGVGGIDSKILTKRSYQSAYSEKVTSISSPSWGLVTGSREGILRRWTSAGGLTQYSSDSFAKIGKNVQRALVHRDKLLVASGDTLLFVGEDLKPTRRMPMHFTINDMCLINSSTLIVCGDGKLAHVNLEMGIYTRFLFASDDVKYVCVSGLTDNVFCVGADDGVVTAIDFLSNQEIGSARVAFPLRGLVSRDRQLIAYGGNWHSGGKSVAILMWEEILHNATEPLAHRKAG
jgi:hypothetical protein